REQPQRVPSLPPRVADACARIENHEVEAELLQVITRGQAGLTAADHDRVEMLPPGFGEPLSERLALLNETVNHHRNLLLAASSPMNRRLPGSGGGDFGKTTHPEAVPKMGSSTQTGRVGRYRTLRPRVKARLSNSSRCLGVGQGSAGNELIPDPN